MTKEVVYIKEDDTYVFECPHCECYIQILRTQLNCKIFRHGTYKDKSLTPINPHASKELCEHLLATNQIYGCGKPLRIFDKAGLLYAKECDYI